MHTLRINHRANEYLVNLDGATILHITKYSGESNFRREVTYSELPPEVKGKILDHFQNPPDEE